MLNPATETSPEEYEKCANCNRVRVEHHYGPDGPGSGFVFTSSTLYCPSHNGKFVAKKARG